MEASRRNYKTISGQQSVDQKWWFFSSRFIVINEVVKKVSNCINNVSKLSRTKIAILIFADNTLLIWKTPKGLQKLLEKFVEFCTLNGLPINTDKTNNITTTRRSL